MKDKSNSLNRNHDWKHAKYFKITMKTPNGEIMELNSPTDLFDVNNPGTYRNYDGPSFPNLTPVAIFNADGTTTYLPDDCHVYIGDDSNGK